MSNPLYRIIQGDALAVLKALPDQCINCCVTSPPYYGLRDYGVTGQVGLEETPDEYVTRLVEIFREVKRVLRDDGTLWLNLGDSYGSTSGDTYTGFNQRYSKTGGVGSKQDATLSGVKGRKKTTVLAKKNLLGIPWRVAFALQADGWYLRQDIIWSKPNPMPESVIDRCTKSHEYIFLLSKNEKYYYDSEAIKEPVAASSIVRLQQPNLENQKGSDRVPGKTNGPMKAVGRGGKSAFRGQGHFRDGLGPANREGRDMTDVGAGAATRNKRDVWVVTTKPCKLAHFATFPMDLIEPCILAGTSEKGYCPICESPWKRVLKREDKGWDGSKYGEDAVAATGGAISGGTAKSTLGSSNGKLVGIYNTLGWQPTCKCPTQEPDHGMVLDPFGGAGTTALVANKHGRDALLVELNPEYCAIAEKRLTEAGHGTPTDADLAGTVE